jgi:hypothetical protein
MCVCVPWRVDGTEGSGISRRVNQTQCRPIDPHRRPQPHSRALLESLSKQEAEEGKATTAWAAFLDTSSLQLKIASLAVKEGVSKFMGGGSEEQEDVVGVRGLDDIKVTGSKGRKADGWMGR